MPSVRLLPNVKRHDLSELPYSPTVWQRLGGPWSITLRAYLWTAPLGILAQPVVEPSFWNDYSTVSIWLLIATLGYLAFGAVLWLGWLAFISRQSKPNASAVLVILIAVVASMSRSATIGLLVGPFGLTGVDWVGRLPFGAFLGFAWVFTSALIMDSKYRYQLHLETLIADQQFLLKQNRESLNQIRQILKKTPQDWIIDSHRHLQQAMREIAILSNDSTKVWSKVTPDIKRTSIQLALATEKDPWISEQSLSGLRGSRSKALAAITTTPLMNVPLVMTFTAIITLFGSTRLYSISFSLAAVAFGIVLHSSIILFFKFLISRYYNTSSFRYFLMIAVLLVTSLLSTAIASPADFDLLVLRTIAFTATVFEIVWLIATGFIQFGQIQRQEIVDDAKLENERLESSLRFWQQNYIDKNLDSEMNNAPLLVVAMAMNRAVETEDLKLGIGAMEFSNLYFAEFAVDILGQDAIEIESELDRLSHIWEKQSELIWSITGDRADPKITRRIVAALEICVSKAIRHGNATIISIDVNYLANSAAIKVTDNGNDYVEGSASLGVEILKELSNGTWQRDRSGGLNIVTAQFS